MRSIFGDEGIWEEVVMEQTFLYVLPAALTPLDPATTRRQEREAETKKKGLALHRCRLPIRSSVLQGRALPDELVQIWGILFPTWETCSIMRSIAWQMHGKTMWTRRIRSRMSIMNSPQLIHSLVPGQSFHCVPAVFSAMLQCYNSGGKVCPNPI